MKKAIVIGIAAAVIVVGLLWLQDVLVEGS